MNKKILLPLAIGALLLASAGAFAANTSTGSTSDNRGYGFGFEMQKLTEEQKTKLDSLTTKEEKDTYLKSILGTGAFDNIRMGMGKMMGGKEGFEMREGKGRGENKSMNKIHKSLETFFEKLDKDYTETSKKEEVLKKVISKVDNLLSDSNLSEGKKEVYNHIKEIINKKIASLEAESVDIDSILNVN